MRKISILSMNPGAPGCAPEPNLPNLNLDVQVRVRRLAAPNLNVQVQVRIKLPEPEPNRTATSVAETGRTLPVNGMEEQAIFRKTSPSFVILATRALSSKCSRGQGPAVHQRSKKKITKSHSRLLLTLF